jgi:hypothetical protein
MAKIKLGATLGDARNAAGAIVYSKNQFGAYIRQKVSPVQPRTPRQTQVRQQFTDISKRWGVVLTDSQRNGWKALAAANPVSDVFGDSQTLTGLQFYQRVSRNLQEAGEPILDDAPADQNVTGLLTLAVNPSVASHSVLSEAINAGPANTYVYSSHTGAEPKVGMVVTITGFTNGGNNITGPILSATGGASGSFVLTAPAGVDEVHAGAADGTDFTVTWTSPTLDTEELISIFATGNLSAGKAFTKPFLKFLVNTAENPTSPFSILATWTAAHGLANMGARVGISASVVRTSNGAATPFMFADAIVT